MNPQDRWLLPEGVEEVLPPRAAALDRLRSELLDLYRCWGYDLVYPASIEFLESLLIGTGNDLDLMTFKLTDQLSGRLMGVRADMSTQVARIDAHQLRKEGPVRLCYSGTVLHTRGDDFGGSRSPMQIGAELYGHAGVESDLEVISLMLESLVLAGIDGLHLDLGHVGIYRGLARNAKLSVDQEATLFDALQRKAEPEIKALLDAWSLDAEEARMLISLARLDGGAEALVEADRLLGAAGSQIQEHLATLRRLAAELEHRYPDVSLHFDLAELRGYHYHTGLVFGAYIPGYGDVVARGGRYDNIGAVFGRGRPATGFSADLKTLLVLGRHDSGVAPIAIFAPRSDDGSLTAAVDGLRARGERVIRELPGQTAQPEALGCDRCLVQHAGDWVVEPIAQTESTDTS